MTDQLSPADQVMIAVAHVYQQYEGEPPARAVAAALRIAAAHEPNSAMYPSSDWGRGWRTGINDTRQGLLTIAAELDSRQVG